MKIKRRRPKQKPNEQPKQKQGWDVTKPLPWEPVEMEHKQDEVQFATDEDSSPIQQIRSEELQRKIHFLDVETPIVAVKLLDKEEKIILPTHELMFGANRYAGLMETKHSLKLVTDAYLNEINFVEYDRGIDNLDRIEIQENGPELWSIQVRYLVDQKGSSSMIVFPDSKEKPFNMDNAREKAEDFIAYSIYVEGKTNDVDGIRQRVFQFDQSTMTVSRSLFRHVKEYVEQQPELHDTSEYENRYFQKFADRFGGKFTDLDIPRLHEDDFNVLHIATAFSLVRGVNKWPF